MAQGSAVLELDVRAPQTQLGYDGGNIDPPVERHIRDADDNEGGYRTQEERDAEMGRLAAAAEAMARRGLISLNAGVFSTEALHLSRRRGSSRLTIGRISLMNAPLLMRSEMPTVINQLGEAV
jgi:hypothetical protein